MSAERDSGIVEAIFVAEAAGADPHPIEAADVIPGRGVRGDRYFAGEGEFWREDKSGQDLTLIEAEALEALSSEHGIELCDPCAHLQSLTRPGVLRGLVNRGGLRADVLAEGTIRIGDSVGPAPA